MDKADYKNKALKIEEKEVKSAKKSKKHINPRKYAQDNNITLNQALKALKEEK